MNYTMLLFPNKQRGGLHTLHNSMKWALGDSESQVRPVTYCDRREQIT